MTTYSNTLIAELAQDVAPEKSGLLVRMNQRMVKNLAKKPVLLLRRAWKLRANGTNFGTEPVVYENSANGVVQVLKLAPKENSATLETRKRVDKGTIEQRIVVELSSGRVINNRITKNFNSKATTRRVLDRSAQSSATD